MVDPETPPFTRPADADLAGFRFAVTAALVPRAAAFARQLVSRFKERGYGLEALEFASRDRDRPAPRVTVLMVKGRQFGICVREFCREDRSKPRVPNKWGQKPPVTLIPTGRLRFRMVHYWDGCAQYHVEFPDAKCRPLEGKVDHIITRVEAEADRWNAIEQERVAEATKRRADAERARHAEATQRQNLLASVEHARRIVCQLQAGQGGNRDLELIVLKWPMLPEPVRAAITTLVAAIA